MKRLTAFFLIVLSLLAVACGCRQQEHIPETVYTGELIEYHPTEPLPDAGLSGLKIEGPESLCATVNEPTVSFTVSFSGIDPIGAPGGGRRCDVKLIRDSEVIETVRDFPLIEGASLDFTVPYTFKRYDSLHDSSLIVEVDYGEDYRFLNIPVTVQDYPDEYYAMTSGDPYPYAITIITNKNVVIVYGKDEAGEYTGVVKTFICSTGVNTPTSGTYKLLHKYEWKELIHGLWGQYATWVMGNILIHSLPYFSPEKDDMWSWQFNRLGGAVSTGCIRMRCCDCKWIFDYCPCGTPVSFVTMSSLPEGITYPHYDDLDLESPNAGWDPTDPDPENPWQPEQPDDNWKALVPQFDELYEAYTTLDHSEYAAFAQSSEIFAPAATEEETP